MLSTLTNYANNRLTPALYPEDARWTAVAFEPSLTLARGTVVAPKGTNQTFLAYDGATNTAALGFLMYDIRTDVNGKVYMGGSTNAAEVNNIPQETAPVYTAGTFDTTELTGLDATSRANLNGRLLGNLGMFKF